MALCYSFCRNLLKVRGLIDLCSLALGPTHCSVESLGKVLDAHGTLEGPTLPHYYSGAELGFILILPNTSLLAFQTLCGTLSTAKAPISLQRPGVVRHERHKGVGCDRTVSRNNDSKLLLVISALSNTRASS